MSIQEHWNTVYSTRRPEEVSWYAPHLQRSMELIQATGFGLDAKIIDVGGGESTLVDDLLEVGYSSVTVLDISSSAVEVTRRRLATRQDDVDWKIGDVCSTQLAKKHFDIWHDRAVFHFLTTEADRIAYVNQVLSSVKRGGHVIVATFGPHGPLKCSGLDVVRYSADEIHNEFGESFQLIEHSTENHLTPNGTTQEFVYCFCRIT